MAHNRSSPLRDATSTGRWILRDIGRELRVARITSGKRQVDVAALIRKSASYVSRVEHGRIAGLKATDLSRHAGSLGLKPSVRLFPVVNRPLDAGQIALLDRLHERIGPVWPTQREVAVGGTNDLRAIDAVLTRGNFRIAVEAITRLADWQAQLRAARLKQRAAGADRLILLILGSPTNRRMLQAIGRQVTDELPIGTRAALHALARGQDPGGDCLILL